MTRELFSYEEAVFLAEEKPPKIMPCQETVRPFPRWGAQSAEPTHSLAGPKVQAHHRPRVDSTWGAGRPLKGGLDPSPPPPHPPAIGSSSRGADGG